MPASDPFSWTQAVPWLLSAGSLGWNWINSRRTSALQKQTRTTTLEIEEFRRIRSALDAVLADFGANRDTFNILGRSNQPVKQLREEIEKAQTDIMEVYFKLDSALARADSSSFLEGEDWQQMLSAKWDQFGDKLNGVYKPSASHIDIQNTLAAASKILTSIIDNIETRLEAEMKRLLNK